MATIIVGMGVIALAAVLAALSADFLTFTAASIATLVLVLIYGEVRRIRTHKRKR